MSVGVFLLATKLLGLLPKKEIFNVPKKEIQHFSKRIFTPPKIPPPPRKKFHEIMATSIFIFTFLYFSYT
jgi:hypothetical protein